MSRTLVATTNDLDISNKLLDVLKDFDYSLCSPMYAKCTPLVLH